MTKTNSFVIGFATVAIALAGASVAADKTPAVALKVEVGDILGLTEEDVRAQLTSLGYEVEEVERYDDELEFEILVDGVEYEIDVSSKTGSVVEIERDDH